MKKLFPLLTLLLVITACGPNTPPATQADRISGTITNWPQGQAGTLHATRRDYTPTFGLASIDANGSFSLTLRTPTDEELETHSVYLCTEIGVPGYTLASFMVRSGNLDIGLATSTNYTPTYSPSNVGEKFAFRVYLEEAFTVTPECNPFFINTVTIPAGWSLLVGEVVSAGNPPTVRLTVNQNHSDLEWYFIPNQ